MANRLHQTKVPLLLGVTTAALGNLGTMFAGDFTEGGKWALLAFRIVTGMALFCVHLARQAGQFKQGHMNFLLKA